jgi:hypothetical protein
MSDRPRRPNHGVARDTSRRWPLDDVITLAITASVTLIFIVYTVVSWPHPSRMSNFNGRKASGPGWTGSPSILASLPKAPNYRATSDQCTAPCSCGANNAIKSGAGFMPPGPLWPAPRAVFWCLNDRAPSPAAPSGGVVGALWGAGRDEH